MAGVTVLSLLADFGKGASTTSGGAGGLASASTGAIRFNGGAGGNSAYLSGYYVVIGGGGGGASGASVGDGGRGGDGQGLATGGDNQAAAGGPGGIALAGGGNGGKGAGESTFGGGGIGPTAPQPGGGGGGGGASTQPALTGPVPGAAGKVMIQETGGTTVVLANGLNSYTVPAGIYEIIVGCLGAAGGGGWCFTGDGVWVQGGGGGGGGAYAGAPLAVFPGDKFEITVVLGTGGTVGPGGAGNGTATTATVNKLPVDHRAPAVTMFGPAAVSLA